MNNMKKQLEENMDLLRDIYNPNYEIRFQDMTYTKKSLKMHPDFSVNSYIDYGYMGDESVSAIEFKIYFNEDEIVGITRIEGRPYKMNELNEHFPVSTDLKLIFNLPLNKKDLINL